ncbi:MAG: bifunctional adenosylcobinamide kinase/adenosylcobinamide-phosphate guanylyltransferase [Elainella sp.]
MTFPNETDRLILVTGPARSGKSEWAEQVVDWLGQQTGEPITYIATAQIDPADSEWQTRILRHQQRRPPDWQTQHVPIQLAVAIRSMTGCLLVDSLGTWLANLLEQDENSWTQTSQDLLHSFSETEARVVLVAEETGWGLVPAYPAGRLFRDRLGQLTRQIGGLAQPVYLVTGGHVLNLSQLGRVLPNSRSVPRPVPPGS